MAIDEDLFDPEFLSRLRSMFFRLRKRRQLRNKGVQPTPAAGFTREFKDHRSYAAGDDLRTLDWHLYARLGQMFIRIFEEVQEFHVHILLDRSRSMVEPYGEKRLMALRLTVALAYLALVGEHRVSILTLAEDVHRQLPPLKGQGHIHAILRAASALEFSGTTDLVGSLRQFRPRRDRRGVVFILSDLFGRAPDQSAEAIRQACRWPAETHVIHLLHPRELEPDFDGELRLVDVETRQQRRFWFTDRQRRHYVQAFAAYMDDLRRSCMRQKVDYYPWTTDRPFEETFLDLLSRGSALAVT